MNISLWIVFVVALFLAIYTGAQAIPLFVLMFAPRLLKFWFIDPIESQRRISASASAREKIDQLRELSFSPLGIKGERILWQAPVYEVALTNPEKDTFASIILGPGDKALGVYLYTALSGGGIVFTRAMSRQPQMEKAGISVKNIPNNDLTTMLASHSQRIREFKHQRITPLSVRDQAARIEATYLFYGSAYFKNTRRNLPSIMPLVSFALALVLLVAVLLTHFLRLPA